MFNMLTQAYEISLNLNTHSGEKPNKCKHYESNIRFQDLLGVEDALDSSLQPRKIQYVMKIL